MVGHVVFEGSLSWTWQSVHAYVWMYGSNGWRALQSGQMKLGGKHMWRRRRCPSVRRTETDRKTVREDRQQVQYIARRTGCRKLSAIRMSYAESSVQIFAHLGGRGRRGGGDRVAVEKICTDL